MVAKEEVERITQSPPLPSFSSGPTQQTLLSLSTVSSLRSLWPHALSVPGQPSLQTSPAYNDRTGYTGLSRWRPAGRPRRGIPRLPSSLLLGYRPSGGSLELRVVPDETDLLFQLTAAAQPIGPRRWIRRPPPLLHLGCRHSGSSLKLRVVSDETELLFQMIVAASR